MRKIMHYLYFGVQMTMSSIVFPSSTYLAANFLFPYIPTVAALTIFIFKYHLEKDSVTIFSKARNQSELHRTKILKLRENLYTFSVDNTVLFVDYSLQQIPGLGKLLSFHMQLVCSSGLLPWHLPDQLVSSFGDIIHEKREIRKCVRRQKMPLKFTRLVAFRFLLSLCKHLFMAI